MSPRILFALLPFQLIGVALLGYGIVRAQWLLRLRRTGVRVSATRLPDDARHAPPGVADGAPVYRRVARFDCPLLGRPRFIAESVASSARTAWLPGERIPVIVAAEPPHAAVVATFRNLYLFPLVYLVAGAAFALVLPLAILLQR